MTVRVPGRGRVMVRRHRPLGAAARVTLRPHHQRDAQGGSDDGHRAPLLDGAPPAGSRRHQRHRHLHGHGRPRRVGPHDPRLARRRDVSRPFRVLSCPGEPRRRPPRRRGGARRGGRPGRPPRPDAARPPPRDPVLDRRLERPRPRGGPRGRHPRSTRSGRRRARGAVRALRPPEPALPPPPGDRRRRALRDLGLPRPDAFHALELYQHLYRRLGVEHQLAAVVPSPPPQVLAITLNRGDRDFDADDRKRLRL